MPIEFSYTTMSTVCESWDMARLHPGFEERMGADMLQKLYQFEPRTKEVFGFTHDSYPTNEDLKASGTLLHVKKIIEMFDVALYHLGPDTETLLEALQELGKRHSQYKVKPNYFGFMGKAFIYALMEEMKDSWTSELERAWTEIYDFISEAMIQSMLNSRECAS